MHHISTRRRFLQRSSILAAAPLILPRRVWAQRSAPSKRLTLGIIGMGRMGMVHLAELPPPKLPAWCKTHGRTTDAYLQQIAGHHGAQLATFDTGIPGAMQI